MQVIEFCSYSTWKSGLLEFTILLFSCLPYCRQIIYEGIFYHVRFKLLDFCTFNGLWIFLQWFKICTSDGNHYTQWMLYISSSLQKQSLFLSPFMPVYLLMSSLIIIFREDVLDMHLSFKGSPLLGSFFTSYWHFFSLSFIICSVTEFLSDMAGRSPLYKKQVNDSVFFKLASVRTYSFTLFSSGFCT